MDKQNSVLKNKNIYFYLAGVVLTIIFSISIYGFELRRIFMIVVSALFIFGLLILVEKIYFHIKKS